MKEGEGGGAKNNETNFIFSPFSVPLRLVVNELLVRFQIVNILLTKRGPYYHGVRDTVFCCTKTMI